MAKQRYNTSIDSLSYAKSEVPYVAPPTKEILALLDSRENRYLKSKTNYCCSNRPILNASTEFKSTVINAPPLDGI